MNAEDMAFILAIINAVNAYAVAMEMAAWSQATATTNAGNLATALTAAVNAYTTADTQEGRIT